MLNLINKVSVLLMLISAVFSFELQNPVKYSIDFSDDILERGDVFTINVDVKIDSGFLIYASDTLNLNPTYIDWADSSYFSKIELMTDSKPPKVKFDKYLQADVLYHINEVIFSQEYQLSDDISEDNILLEGEFIYQACDDKMCIPFFESFSKEISIVNTSTEIIKVKDSNSSYLDQKSPKGLIGRERKEWYDIHNWAYDHTIDNEVLEISIKKDLNSKTETESTSIKGDLDKEKEELVDFNSEKESTGIIAKFFIAFLGGLIAIITPCVFPMIPMTVAFFSKGAEKDRKRAIRSGLLFGASIIGLFIAFGVIFSFVFKTADIMNEIATGAISNIIFAVIFIVFAISFFGYFEIRLPNKFLNKMNKKADSGGLIGTIFMALTLVLVSFSCTAPIVGTVMIDAMSGSFWGPIVAMLGFSLAFAIPFSLFAIFPSWLQSLPASGGWLNSVKVVLGFLELGLAIKFLSMPDLAYHWGILPRDIFLLIWILISFSLGLYLFGAIKFPHDSNKIKFGFGRIITILINMVFCFYMILGIYGFKIPLLAGIIPPEKSISCGDGTGLCDDNPTHSDLLHLPHGLEGYFDYNEALECAIEQNKPLFIDFTGHACFNCRRMEEVVWSDERVLDILKNDFILVALYVDDRTSLDKESWYISKNGKERKTIGKKNFFIQLEKFNANAQPYYVILDPFTGDLEQNIGKTIKPLVDPKGYDTDIEGFIDFLNKGKENFYNKRGIE